MLSGRNQDMSESVSFWLDNKMSAGIKVAELEGQLLVTYRDKFYVVVNGAAQMRGSRALHYSRSSLPAIWRKALLEEAPPLQAEALPEHLKETGPAAVSANLSHEEEKSMLQAADSERTAPQPEETPHKKKPQDNTRPPKPAGKSGPPVLAQEFVEAKCPYCSHTNEIMLDKSKRAKPFFTPCAKCDVEFAVRLVQVTIYQAQVAGFR